MPVNVREHRPAEIGDALPLEARCGVGGRQALGERQHAWLGRRSRQHGVAFAVAVAVAIDAVDRGRDGVLVHDDLEVVGGLATVPEHRIDGHRLAEHDVDPPAPPHRQRWQVVEPVPGERITGTLQIGRFHRRPDRALPGPQERHRGATGAPSRADVLHRPACRKVRRERLARRHDRDAGRILLTEARPHVSRDERGGRDVVEQVVEE